MLKKIALSLGLVLYASVLLSCSPASEQTGQTLHRGNNAEPLTLDPQRSNGYWENVILGDMFIGLFTENAAGEPVPGMAKSWTVSEDGLVWVFELREAYCSDGEPVTAEDFEFSYQRILNPDTLAPYATILQVFKNATEVIEGRLPPSAVGVTAIDDKTLRVELEYPAPYLPGLLAHVTSYPVPKHIVEVYGDAWVQPNTIAVNGAFVLREWRNNEYIHLVRNAHFFDNENVCLDEIYYHSTPNSVLSDRMVRNGELDVAMDFTGDSLAELRETLPNYVRTHMWVGLVYLSFNMNDPILSNPDIRQALALAVDREYITENVTQSGEIPAYSFVPHGMNAYDQSGVISWASQSMQMRRREALRLLEALGHGPEHPLELRFKYRMSGHGEEVARAVKRQWEGLADWISIELEGAETRIHYAELRAADFQLGDSAWIGDYNDAYNFLFLAETDTGAMNYSRYSNPQYDALLDQANRINDMSARASLLAEAEQLMLDDLPYVPLYFQINKALVHPNLQGWEDNLFHVHRSRYLCWGE